MQCFLAYLQNCTITTTIRIFHLQQIPYLLVDTPFSSLHLAPLAPTHLFSMSLPILDLLYNVQSLLTGFSQQSYQCSSMLQHISDISISFLLMTKQYPLHSCIIFYPLISWASRLFQVWTMSIHLLDHMWSYLFPSLWCTPLRYIQLGQVITSFLSFEKLPNHLKAV